MLEAKYSHWTPPMRFNRAQHYAAWDRPDYKGRVVLGVYSNEALDWLVTQDPQGIEIYGSPHSSSMQVRVVGVPRPLYSLFALKFG